MKTALFSAALAAGLACGASDRAEARFLIGFSLYGTITSGYDGGAFFQPLSSDLTGDKILLDGDFYANDDGTLMMPDSSTLRVYEGSQTSAIYSVVSAGSSVSISPDGLMFGAKLVQSVYSSVIQYSETYTQVQFLQGHTFAMNGTGVPLSFSLSDALGTTSITVDQISSSYAFYPTVTPLPSSAPMFGAALLALGAAGYAAKRKKAAATA